MHIASSFSAGTAAALVVLMIPYLLLARFSPFYRMKLRRILGVIEQPGRGADVSSVVDDCKPRDV